MFSFTIASCHQSTLRLSGSASNLEFSPFYILGQKFWILCLCAGQFSTSKITLGMAMSHNRTAFGARILFLRRRAIVKNYFGWARFGRRLSGWRGLCQGLCRGLSRRHRTSLQNTLEIRNADFKGCVWLPLLLLLFINFLTPTDP